MDGFTVNITESYLPHFKFVSVMRHDWAVKTMCREGSVDNAIQALKDLYPGDEKCGLCGQRIPKAQPVPVRTRRGAFIPMEDRRRYVP